MKVIISAIALLLLLYSCTAPKHSTQSKSGESAVKKSANV